MNLLKPFLWVTSVIIAFSLGHFGRETEKQAESSYHSNADTQQTASVVKQLEVTFAAKSHPLNGNIAENRIESIRQFESTEDAVNLIHRELSNMVGYDLGSIARAYTMVAQLNSQQLKNALDHLAPFANDSDYQLTLQLLIDRFATESPSIAMQYVSDKITNTKLRNAPIIQVLSKWVYIDPIAALDWHRKNRSESPTYDSLETKLIFKGLANQDIDLAIQTLSDFSGNPYKTASAASGIASTLDEPWQFIAFLEKIKFMDSNEINNRVLGEWVQKDNDAVLNWFDALDDSEKSNALAEDIYSHYRYSDPEASANWFLAQSTPATIDENLKKIIESWGHSAPETALTWVNKQSGIDTQKAIKEVLSSVVYFNPNFVVNNLELIDSDSQKANISYSIYLGLERESTSKANAFVNSSKYKQQLLITIERMKQFRE